MGKARTNDPHCLHPLALDDAMGEQMENLSDVAEHTRKEARAFFAKSHITRGMELLLRQMQLITFFRKPRL